jgi:hypothetical protein
VGLDYSDRLGRFSKLNGAASYSTKDYCALLEMNEKGKFFRLDLSQIVSHQLRLGTEVCYDRRKDRKTLRLRSKFALNESESVSSSLGSDGILVGAFAWRASKQLKTKISAQMDVRNYESDSHHLSVSIEIL